jgi:hypothetical protein
MYVCGSLYKVAVVATINAQKDDGIFFVFLGWFKNMFFLSTLFTSSTSFIIGILRCLTCGKQIVPLPLLYLYGYYLQRALENTGERIIESGT